MLAVITCHYNPCNYSNIKNNFFTFRENLSAPLYTAELSFNNHFDISDATLKIHGTKENLMWQKERLLNILIEQLPSKYTMIAWIDADIIFQNDNWYNETIEKLKYYPVVQLFEKVIDLDKNGNPMKPFYSDGYGIIKNISSYKRPGGAWAARREVLKYGLADEHILGGSDTMMLFSWRGNWYPYFVHKINKKWRYSYYEFMAKTYPLVLNNINYVSGDILHLYHGNKKNRKYLERWNYLIDNDFDPKNDLKIDNNGLWKWNSNKLEMHKLVENYFHERQEDD